MRRKWSGHDVPRPARRASFSRAQKSSTAAASVKWPTCAWSVDASPRMTGASAAARARRASSGSGSNPATTGPNGSATPRVARNASAVRMISSEFASHASLVSPQAVMPWPPRMTPIACGIGLLARPRSRGRAGIPAGATAPTRRDRRSTPWSAPRRRSPWPARSPSRDGDGRRGRYRRGRAWPCRSTVRRRRVRAGSSRRRRPSRLLDRRRGRRRRARERDRAGARRDPPSSTCRDRRRNPSPTTARPVGR